MNKIIDTVNPIIRTLQIFLCTQCFEIPIYCDPLLDIVALGYHIKANQYSLEKFCEKAD